MTRAEPAVTADAFLAAGLKARELDPPGRTVAVAAVFATL